MWGFMGGGRLPDKFEEQYHCYSPATADKPHLEQGDKILLPPSAFDILARLSVDYPMLFRLQSDSKLTHCGVLEFTAEEGTCVVPWWMMQNLLIQESAVITVTNVSLPKASFVKLKPHQVDFLDITNHRAVLEHSLRNFSCITKGDVICVPYNNRNYHLEIREVQPQDAVCIIETDCNVDFEAPVGYEEPTAPGSAPGSAPNSGGLANLKKQSAYAPAEHRSSVCPSPTPSSLSAGTNKDGDGAGAPAEGQTGGTRIVDGKIVRADEESNASGPVVRPSADLMASQTGATGVQRNSAIGVQSPAVDYWALHAGAQRLDGKAAPALKDKEGKEVDLRQIRAEAAARRAAEAAKLTESLPTTGQTIKGATVKVEDAAPKAGGAPRRKNKSRVGSKYSKLKGTATAFHGGPNQF